MMHLAFQHYGSGEPLIVLHGLFGARSNWHSISRELATHYQVIAVDQRNHGASPHTERMSYPEMAEDLRALLDRLALERVHLLGHSMGGKTAMQFALSYPQRTHRLIVVDIAPRAYPSHHDTILEALNALDLAAARSRSDLDRQLARWIDDAALRQFLLTNVTRDAQGRFVWRINLPAITQQYPNLLAAVDGPPFAGPTLFIRGERSDYITEAARPDIERLFPHAHIVTVPGAGHWVHAEAPAEVVRLVRAFLDSEAA